MMVCHLRTLPTLVQINDPEFTLTFVQDWPLFAVAEIAGSRGVRMSARSEISIDKRLLMRSGYQDLITFRNGLYKNI